MLRSLLSMTGYGVGATDGDLGVLRDFYLDDETWMIRFIVVATGGGAGRRVLLSPTPDCCRPDWNLQLLHVGVTTEDVLQSPDVDTAKPVSRQQAFLLNAYYTAKGLVANPASGRRKLQQSSSGDPHLRSFEEIRSYAVNAMDGPAGRVYDLIVDTSNWEVCYLAVEKTEPQFAKALVSTNWITTISWADKALRVDLSVEALRSCPPYVPSSAINRDDENRLYDYHGRPKPWGRATEAAPESLQG